MPNQSKWKTIKNLPENDSFYSLFENRYGYIEVTDFLTAAGIQPTLMVMQKKLSPMLSLLTLK
jgi:hypothetical protein